MIISDELFEQLKSEYITTDISMRAIAKKYGVSFYAMSKRATADHWTEQREQIKSTKSTGKEFAPVAEAMEDRAAAIRASTDRLMFKVNQLLELDEPLAPRDLKAITGALLDMKMLYNVRSDDEMRETAARIRKLEKEAEPENSKKEPITIVFGNGEDLL